MWPVFINNVETLVVDALNVVSVKHESGLVMAPEAKEKIKEGDVVLAQGDLSSRSFHLLATSR